MQISFYVLSENKAQDFLGFVCQLTQTALNKSNQSLLILTEDDALLDDFDQALWAHDASSFIPHQRLASDTTIVSANSSLATNKMLAPVLLGTYLPAEFNGIIINTTSHPINDFMTATSNAQPTRILEIIKPDAASVQEGRIKYKRYQQLDYKLTHFKV
ncbi:DNA polymerase-3 subunit chi [Psychrobacter sp. PL15]|uniref:DNA polymerase III subunit chi n=1 Tax=unclassified Psychrobacter TaxID=196806 RepID=UPI001AE47BC2|nr:DNA polymerase III subunit chi [Psychrobacter sp. PL15]MEC5209737.1 DNA polymerase-3 subunit chi [Psychrobacter sp. PL15]